MFPCLYADRKKSLNLSFKSGRKFIELCLVCLFRKGSVPPCQDEAAHFRFRLRVGGRARPRREGADSAGREQRAAAAPAPHGGHGDAVPPALRRARVPQHQAEAAELGAHALGHDRVRAGGRVLLPHHRR